MSYSLSEKVPYTIYTGLCTMTIDCFTDYMLCLSDCVNAYFKLKPKDKVYFSYLVHGV
jgi:hypothetical protein